MRLVHVTDVSPRAANGWHSWGQPAARSILGSAKDIRVLVVDDFSTMRGAIRTILQHLGNIDVTDVEDGGSALLLLKSGNFDLLVTDWSMPGMSGLELLRQVRADERLAKLPVLMLTAETERARIIKAMEAGVTAYIVKPFTTAELRGKIAKMLAAQTTE
jgi:two-component system, chemotaxis family, chemotaxis protein CheY